MNTPTYLLQWNTGEAYGYWDETLLRIDLHRVQVNFELNNVRILKLVPGMVVKYEPIDFNFTTKENIT